MSCPLTRLRTPQGGDRTKGSWNKLHNFFSPEYVATVDVLFWSDSRYWPHLLRCTNWDRSLLVSREWKTHAHYTYTIYVCIFYSFVHKVTAFCCSKQYVSVRRNPTLYYMSVRNATVSDHLSFFTASRNRTLHIKCAVGGLWPHSYVCRHPWFQNKRMAVNTAVMGWWRNQEECPFLIFPLFCYLSISIAYYKLLLSLSFKIKIYLSHNAVFSCFRRYLENDAYDSPHPYFEWKLFFKRIFLASWVDFHVFIAGGDSSHRMCNSANASACSLRTRIFVVFLENGAYVFFSSGT